VFSDGLDYIANSALQPCPRHPGMRAARTVASRPAATVADSRGFRFNRAARVAGVRDFAAMQGNMAHDAAKAAIAIATDDFP
jgi:hypothetical protein